MMTSSQGFSAWLMQRISAIYLLFYMLIAGFCALFNPLDQWQQWQHLFNNPWFNIATQGFILAIILHAWIGMRDIVIDYINHFIVRLVVLTGIAICLILCMLWTFSILIPAL